MHDPAKPTIVHVVGSFTNGGIEQGLLTLAKQGFYDRDYNVKIVQIYEGEGFMHDEMAQVLGSENFIALGTARNIIPTDQLPPVRRIIRKIDSAFHMAHVAWNLKKTLDAIGPDAVILSHPISHVTGCAAAIAKPNLKVINFEHGTARDSRLLRVALKLTSWRCNLVFGDSQITLDTRIADNYLLKKPGVVVPLTVFPPQPPREIRKPDIFQTTSLGRLSPEKNFPELIHAAARLAEEGYNLQLTIAGGGDQETEIKALLDRLHAAKPDLNIHDIVKLPGFQSGDDKDRLLKKTDIYIQPSLNEGFCIALAEAMNLGIPCIATRFGGSDEYGTGANMIKTEGYTRDDLYKSLKQMMDNYANIASDMSREAQKTMQENYSLKPVWKLWNAALDMIKDIKPVWPKSPPPSPPLNLAA